jgi:hypothetical protein
MLVRCIKNCCLNKLFDFLFHFGPIKTYNFVKINIITPNYVYYKIVQSALRYEYSTTLFIPKAEVRFIRNGYLKISGRKIIHNF